MSKALIVLMGCTLCILLLAEQSSAVDPNSFSISKKLGNKNVDPAMAYNIQTGDVLVVWTSRTDNSSSGKIYASLVKLVNGKPKLSKARVVSAGAQNELHSCPDVAYHTSTNSYYAVWSRKHDVGGYTMTDLNIREINASGRPVGKATMVTADESSEHFEPEILPNYKYSGSGGQEKASLILCWYSVRYSNDNSKDGLYYAFSDTKGTLLSPEKMLIAAQTLSNNISGKVIPDDFIQSYTDGSYFIGLHRLGTLPAPAGQNSETGYYATVLEMDNDGKMKGFVDVDSGSNINYMRIAQAANKLFISTWLRSSMNITMNQAIKSRPKKSKKSYQPFPEDTLGSDVVLLDTGGVVQFFGGGGSLFYQIYTARGKKSGDLVRTDGDYGYDFRAEMIGRSNYYLMVFVSNYNSVPSEITGSLIRIDNPQ